MVVNATTLARVRAHLGKTDTDTVFDALIGTTIDSVSRAFEKFLGYELEQKSRLELYSPSINERTVYLRQRPVVSVTLVRVAIEGTWDFAAYSSLVANDHYRLIGNELYFSYGIIYGKETLEVTYTAGIGANDAALITAAPELAFAADIQVGEEWRRRDNPAQVTVPGPKGSKTLDTPHRLLPRVQELLMSRKRMVFVS